MDRKPFTPAQEKYIRDHRLKISGAKIAEALGCSETKLRNFMRREGLTVPKEVSAGFRGAALRGRTTWSEEQTQFLKNNYLKMGEKPLARAIGKSSTSVKVRMKQLGLEVPQEIIEERKKNSRFQKGQRSYNKGLKQTEFLSPEAIERSKKTRFKKGNLPHNAAEKDGAISLRKETSSDITYKYIRVSLGKWELLHRVNWEKANGPIPEGYVVRFKNGNTMNCSLENLELVTMAENLRRNWHDYPQPLKRAIKLTNKLKSEL